MLVADASVVLEWFLPGQWSPAMNRAFQLARKSLIVVPALWQWETQNVILSSIRRKTLTREQAAEIRMEMALISKRIDAPPDDWIIDRTWDVATTQMITFYDASYIELALRLGIPVASSDRGIRHAATGMGVELI